MKKATLFCLIAFIYLSLSGCNQQDTESIKNNIQPMNTSTSGPHQKINQHDAKLAKELLLQKNEVKKVRAVEAKDLLIAAVELKHQYTFQSKKLTREMKKYLEKHLDVKNVEVTTDHKIFIELDDLEGKINKNKLSNKELETKLKKINKLMKEQT